MTFREAADRESGLCYNTSEFAIRLSQERSEYETVE